MSDFSEIGSSRRWRATINTPPRTLKHADLYYSRDGEDVALRTFFKRRIHELIPGTYVDIGCLHPIASSNTYLFYCLGWSGVAIDLNKYHAPKWASERERDKFVCAAVGLGNVADVYQHKSNLGMTSIAAQPNADFTLAGKLQTRPLAEILDETLSAGCSVQFMSIDVEGAEVGVLQSNDWDKWRPEAILIETQGLRLEDPYAHATTKYLRDLNYTIRSVVGGNVLVVDSKH